MPEALVDQLADGGIMILPLKEGRDIQRLLRLIRTGDKIQTEQLDEVRFVPLISDNGTS
jgi:protein-L-isoaspartate(D-aspartate) O-methyltransferase